MTKGWYATLNGVSLSGGDDLPVPISVDDVVGCLTGAPDGLGVPGLRVEDVTYPQRDGVEMFSDWYENRVLTLQASISGDDCGTDLARTKALRLSQAWSRLCGETELVIWPDDTSGDPETAGPFGVVGRPRVATLNWLQGTKRVADALLRFDSVDHRLYILDEDGTPGSGAVCQTVTDTPIIETMETLAASGFAEHYFPMTEGNRVYRDVLYDDHASVQNNATSLTGWAGATSLGGTTSLVLSSDPDGEISYSAAGTAGVGASGTLDLTLTQAIAASTVNPYVVFRGLVSGNFVNDSTLKIQAQFNGGGTFFNPVWTTFSNGDWAYQFTGAITSVKFRLTTNRQAPYTTPTVFTVRSVDRSPGPLNGGAGFSGTSQQAPQIAPGTSPTSVQNQQMFVLAPTRDYTTAMLGWWQADADTLGGSMKATLGGLNFTVGWYYNLSVLLYEVVWNGTHYPFNSFLQGVWTSPDPVFIMLTWSSTVLRVWTSVDNGGLYPQPHLAQEFTFPAALPAGSVVDPLLSPFTTHVIRVSDIIAGRDHYNSPAMIEQFVSAVTSSGLINAGQFTLPDVGTECSPLTITFVGGNNPKVIDAEGNFVGVNMDLGADVTAVVDTGTGTVTVNGVVNNSLIEGDPFFVAAPGSSLTGAGGGDITVCFRPAVISA